MTGTNFQLVHTNTAFALASFDDPIMKGFVDRNEEIDGLAQGWPGFVAQPVLTDEGLLYPEPALLNVSIWESIESLRAFTYSQHGGMLKRREEWFFQSPHPAYVLYWSPAGETTSEKEIEQRFEHLQLHGSIPYAFTFDEPYTSEEMLNFTSNNRGLGFTRN